MKNVLITARSFTPDSAAAKHLRDNGIRPVWNPYDHSLQEADLVTLLPGMDAYIAGLEWITAAAIEAATPQLQIIARCGVGYDRVDLAAAAAAGIPVTITAGANSVAVAELTLALMLAVARCVTRQDASLRAGSWDKLIGPELAGKTLGIIGLGAIGSEVAKRAQAFGMRLIAYDICQRPSCISEYGVRYLPLADLLAESDFVSLHAPANTATAGMINRETLRLMKPTAYLINTARGELVVEADLCAALREGVIAGAGIDVYVCEPLPAGSALTQLDNVVLTPHSGAGTYEAAQRMTMAAAEEVVRVLSGQKPLHAVALG
ncbi:MAG: phosphoglycerate dehydrogenase [Sporomusaceae bacterium]|nr:phosphoglycerate dehydrogenase [Sporomusaceae bacterium]